MKIGGPSTRHRLPVPGQVSGSAHCACVGSKGRHLLLLPEPLQNIQTQARAQQQTPEWKRRYDLRAGCEATVSETVRAHGLRYCRYRGLAKTRVQHVLTAAGTNIIRLAQHQPDQRRRPRSRLQELFHAS